VGYDAAKKVKGRKNHALVDSEGLPMRVVVHSAAVQDRDGAALVLDKIRRRFPWLELIWADSAYNAAQVDVVVAKQPDLRLQIVKRSDDIKGSLVLPRVERTFSWSGRNRRLAKDFENLAETLAAFVTIASIQLALMRLARPQAFESRARLAAFEAAHRVVEHLERPRHLETDQRAADPVEDGQVVGGCAHGRPPSTASRRATAS
jgi:transposase